MSCDDYTTEETVTPATLCDLDRTDNVWVEGDVCMLDTLREDQVIYILQRDEKARADLCRVTSNEHLRELAATVPRLSTERPGDKLQKQGNQNTIPFYATFKGRPPTAR